MQVLKSRVVYQAPKDPAAGLRVDEIRIEWQEDPDGISLYAQSEAEGIAERIEAYEIGHWEMLFVNAVAEVSYPIYNGDRRIQRFESGGLSGIESDSDDGYLAELEREQLDDLRDHLQHFSVAWPDFGT